MFLIVLDFCTDPQEFAFPVLRQSPVPEVSSTEIPLGNIKLYKKFTGQCSNQKIWRSRVTCLGILYTLMGSVLLLISLRVKCEDDHVLYSSFSHDIKWVLQSRRRSQ